MPPKSAKKKSSKDLLTVNNAKYEELRLKFDEKMAILEKSVQHNPLEMLSGDVVSKLTLGLFDVQFYQGSDPIDFMAKGLLDPNKNITRNQSRKTMSTGKKSVQSLQQNNNNMDQNDLEENEEIHEDENLNHQEDEISGSIEEAN